MKRIQFLIIAIICLSLDISYGQQQSELHKADHNAATVVNGKSSLQSSANALKELKAGNLRFVDNQLINTDYKSQIEQTKSGQKPHSVILTCMDSRVPPEIIFDQGIGNIFVLRVAGNVEDDNMLGSMEYAVEHTGSKLLVVMGHNHCGAVTGAVQHAGSGMLTQLLDQINPAIPADRSDPDIIEKTVKNSVNLTITDILAKSKVIRELVDEHKIAIVGAFYDIENGVVTFME
jgi:carbonic anhydrase